MRMCSGLARGSAAMPTRPKQAGREALDLVAECLDVSASVGAWSDPMRLSGTPALEPGV